MKRIETSKSNPEELRLALLRPALEETELSPAAARRTAELFGEALTPLEAVRRILADVEAHGDAAVVEYTERIDGVKLDPETLFVDGDEIARAREEIPPENLEAIRTACERIRRFHEAQRERSWFIHGPQGEILGQRIAPLERVACYVPGGRAPLVSTALMSVVPAKVAGVGEVIVATPPGPGGRVNSHILAAAAEAGADRVLRVGGAQAIAALAYGTTWIPKVDKIVGPGNVFVTLAKKLVFGRVGIDALNGPSEIAVVADGSADPRWVAADLLSQAEHDTEAAAMLFTDSPRLADAVLAEVDKQLETLPRREVARESLERWGMVVVCRDLDEAIEWVNAVAPEHVELIVSDPWAWLDRVRFAGAVFLGPWSTEPVGDYVAGPNHILPTNGTARFASPLGVYDFVRRTSVIAFNRQAVEAVAAAGVRFGRLEELEAHARAIEARLGQEPAGNEGDGTGSFGKEPGAKSPGEA